jgi:predicted TIM-barrel fold metal-dependent hydrolase
VDRQKYWASKAHVTREEALSGRAAEATREAAWDYDRRPSDVFRDHIYGCFIDEEFGVRIIDEIGVDNVMIETDYPHTDSSWPHSREWALDRLKDRSFDERYQILRGNAERVFNFVPATPPS